MAVEAPDKSLRETGNDLGTVLPKEMPRKTFLAKAVLPILTAIINCLATQGCDYRRATVVTASELEWPNYGGDPGGQRYSAAVQINRLNVRNLQVAWSVRAGDFSPEVFDSIGHRAGNRREDGSPILPVPGAPCGACHRLQARFESTPLMRDGTVYLSTPLNRVLALDPASGAVRWTFDPNLDRTRHYVEGLVSRGVSYWSDTNTATERPCARRVFLATVDARLFALDAVAGSLCQDFGRRGAVRLDSGVALSHRPVEPGQYAVSSPPAVVNDVVVVGSTIANGQRQDVESGLVRAYDARSGALRWSFDPIARMEPNPATRPAVRAVKQSTGAANAWSIISADAGRDMVFLPTASAAPNYYGGQRPGRNDFANSVVALRASTGVVAWSFQVVHHDVWDYDLAAQPMLVTLQQGHRDVPAVVVGTKTGMIFVLNRDTGAPLYPVEERRTAASDVPGEYGWPTQPFPPPLFSLHGTRLTPDSAFGITERDRGFCRDLLLRLRNDGLFTPPSLRGTIQWPGAWGGINWDGMAWDPKRQIVVTTLKRLAMIIQLQQRNHRDLTRQVQGPGGEYFAQEGTPYSATRRPFVSPSGIPCSPPPWGSLVAVDLGLSAIRWQRSVGVIPALKRVSASESWGSLIFGGPLVTAGGLVFIGASQDDRFRAFDIDTGDLLWEYHLPAGGQATPMTYVYHGRQYVVITAGGRAGIGSPGDWIVAFALSDPSDYHATR